MSLVLVSFNHHHSPFELLSRIALSEPIIPQFLQSLKSQQEVKEVVCLSTCNRIELYFVADSSEAVRRIALKALAEARHVSVDELSAHALVLEESEARRHLLATTSGITSLIVGEVEILGQVRRALETADAASTAGPVLNELFRRAIKFGRRVRRTTKISQGNTSVASAAFTLIYERVPNLTNARALVIGTGEVGQTVLRLLRSAGVPALMLINRTSKKAESLAEEFGCTPVPMEKMVEAVSESDIVICATGAPHYVIYTQMVQTQRPGRSRVLMDLSAPANIEPAVASVPGNILFTISDLQFLAEENASLRQQEVMNVTHLIDEEIARSEQVAQSSMHSELIREFRTTVETVRAQHLERYGKRLDDATRADYDHYSRSLVSALLHDITMNMNQIPVGTEDAERELEFARRLLLSSFEEESRVGE